LPASNSPTSGQTKCLPHANLRMPSLFALLDLLGRLDAFWASVWVVLAVLTVVLLVLLATRRGDTEPLHKYIVLSVWAHVLLAAYAGSVQVMLSGPGSPRDNIIHLALADQPISDESVADDVAAPWEQSVSQPVPKVEEPDLDRVAPEPPAPHAEPAPPADEPAPPVLPQAALHQVDSAPPAEPLPTLPREEKVSSEPTAPETIEVAQPGGAT